MTRKLAPLIAIAALTLVGCSDKEKPPQDCELSHYNTIIIPSGKTMIPIMQPVYDCKPVQEHATSDY